LIRVKVNDNCPDVDFHKNVLLVLTVPAEYSHKERAIMRECAFKADLTGEENTENLQFTTERT